MEQTSTTTAIKPVSEKDSLRLALLKFISCIAIIYIHAYTPQYSAFGTALNKLPLFRYIAEVFSQHMATVALPVFLGISGYIYFSKQYSQKWYVFAMRKAKSILLPYLMWNTLTIAYIFVAQQPESLRNIFPANKVIANFSFENWINAYIGWGNEWYPFLYPLWFLPCLFAVFVLVHIFRQYFYKYKWLIWVLTGLNIVSFAYVPLYRIMADWGPFLRMLYSLSFFVAGKVLLEEKRFFESKLVLIVAAIVFASSVALSFSGLFPNIKWLVVSLYSGLTIVFIISGKAAEYCIKFPKHILFLSGFSFVIYLTHEFALTAVLNFVYPALPLNSGIFLAVYFLLPLCLAASQICCAWVLKKLLPQVYTLLFGGR